MKTDNGFALSQLPERFQQQPRESYISRKYGKTGFRKVKEIEYGQEFSPQGSPRDKYRWVENVSAGLRHVGPAHEIIRLNHTGWYTDNFQDKTVHGEVYQLPARNREPQYVPANNDPYNDNCAIVDFSSVTVDKEDAARWADSMAQQYAEREREYQAKDDADNRIEEIKSEIKELHKDYRAICKEIRATGVKTVPVVRQLVCARNGKR